MYWSSSATKSSRTPIGQCRLQPTFFEGKWQIRAHKMSTLGTRSQLLWSPSTNIEGGMLLATRVTSIESLYTCYAPVLKKHTKTIWIFSFYLKFVPNFDVLYPFVLNLNFECQSFKFVHVLIISSSKSNFSRFHFTLANDSTA